ncbi:MAG: hypothetical protein PVI90_20370 [Desulfobacteraceae bacterium]|jgi:hypothetical protein
MDDPIHKTCLQFFGTMAASISHEIKNRMAIINEQAGLLTDFIKMAENGRPLDSQRLERLAAAVKAQVSLTDVIIKNMNQFAHSVDHMNKLVDLKETLGLAVALFKRKSEGCGLRLEIQTPQTPFTVETSPFLLMNLIWICLLPLITEKQQDQLLTFMYEKCKNKFHVNLVLDGVMPSKELLFSKAAISLAEMLGATLTLNAERNILKIELPEKPLIQSTI